MVHIVDLAGLVRNTRVFNTFVSHFCLFLLSQLRALIKTNRGVSAVKEPKAQTRRDDSSDDIADRNGDNALVDEFADSEVCTVEHADRDQVVVGDAMLIAHDDESPDRDPDGVDLRDVVVTGSCQVTGQRDEPVAADTSKEVHRPLYVDATFSLCSCVRLLFICL